MEDEHRKMNRDDFDFIAGRIDRMELTVASAISKVMKIKLKFENSAIILLKLLISL